MKATTDFQQLYAQGDTHRGYIEFSTKRRHISVGYINYYEDGAIKINGLEGKPDARGQVNRDLSVSSQLLADIRGSFRTIDGRKLTKKSIRCSTLLIDFEHGIAVNADRGVTYFGENHHPTGDKPIQIHTMDKEKVARYKEILTPIVAQFVVEGMEVSQLGGQRHRDWNHYRKGFQEVIRTGTLNKWMGEELASLMNTSWKPKTPQQAITEVVGEYGYDQEEAKHIIVEV